VHELVIAGIGAAYKVATARKAELLATATGTGIAFTLCIGIFRPLVFQYELVVKLGTLFPSVLVEYLITESNFLVPWACYQDSAVIAVQSSVTDLSFRNGSKIRYESVFRLEEPYQTDDKQKQFLFHSLNNSNIH
jgi:hypothetical protein